FQPPLPVSFKCQDMQKVNFTGATAIYLYGTCLDDEVIKALVRRFEKLPPSVQIITVSYPLSDYSPQFQVRKQFTVNFPWGEGDVYVNSRKV
ncbi:MAG TPA: class I SAM-dependent methyltransferase, partial [Rhabdochlamydiaceae bacterium]